MKLILKQEVSDLGTLGDVVDVKPGYARNYLLPRGLALPVTGQQSKEFRHHMQYLEKMRKGEIAQAQQKAALDMYADPALRMEQAGGNRSNGGGWTRCTNQKEAFKELKRISATTTYENNNKKSATVEKI